MTEARTTAVARLRDGRVASLRDDDPRNDEAESIAIAFGLGLAAARIVVGTTEVLFPKLFLRALGRRGSATDGAALGFRMKGGRDAAIGLATLGAAALLLGLSLAAVRFALGDRSTFAQLTAAGVIIDGVDGLAVARDGGRTLRSPVHPVGAWLGYAVALGAAVAAWVLGRDDVGPRG